MPAPIKPTCIAETVPIEMLVGIVAPLFARHVDLVRTCLPPQGGVVGAIWLTWRSPPRVRTLHCV